jgi:hypothetical protein
MQRSFIRFTAACSTLTLLASLLLTAARADESDVAAGIATAIIRQASIKCLTDRAFPFAEATFKGTAKAVEPGQNVEVEVVDFSYIPGRVVVVYDLTARFQYDGIVNIEKKAQPVKATADISAEISLTANYREEGGGFVIVAKIDKFDDFAVKVLELDPASLPGGKEAVAKLAEKALAEHTEVLIKDVNAWLKENHSF